MNHASQDHFPRPRLRFARGLMVGLLGAALVFGAACDDPNDTGDGGNGANGANGNGTTTPTASATGTTGTGGTGSGEPQGGGATATPTSTVEANYGLSPGGSPTPAATAAAAGGSAVERALAANIGQDAPQSLLDEWDIDITPDGTGLPDGSGSVPDGADVYAQGCARCHGSDGTGSELAPRLVLGDEGQPGPWEYGAPRTVANYWPYLTTYIDFIRRAMPFDQPNTLTDDQLYAVTAWILNQNGMLPDDATLDRDAVMDMNELPNLDSFFSCYPQGCRPEPELRGSQQGGGGQQGEATSMARASSLGGNETHEDTEGAVIATCTRAERSPLMSKPETTSILLGVEDGVAGDVHAGPGDRQVALIDQETRRALIAQVGPLACGALGENLVLDVPARALQPGTLLRFSGGALVQVTGARTPCVELEQVASGLLRAAVGRCGYFAAVRRGGLVSPGDRVTPLAAAAPRR